MKYEATDTFGDHVMGLYDTKDEAIYAIRLYCVQNDEQSNLPNQDFVTLHENGNEITYEIPIGFFPTKPKSSF